MSPGSGGGGCNKVAGGGEGGDGGRGCEGAGRDKAAEDARREGGDGAEGVGADDEVDPRAEARAEGERAFAAGMAMGQIIVTAGYSGEIRIFENVGLPCWL